jgi:parallel beta-helix repeat protein
MRYTDPRILTTLILGMLFTGVFAYAVYTASLDSNVFQAPTIKADSFYVGAQTLAQFILSTAPSGGASTRSYTYIIYKETATYYALKTADSTITSNANFNTLYNSVITACVSGNTVYLEGGTYTLSAPDLTLKSGVGIYGAGYGTIIDASALTSDERVFYGYGSLGAALNLNANALVRAKSLTLTSTGSVVEGDWFFLQSTAIWESNSKNMPQGEIHRAGTVVPNVSIAIPLDGCIMDTYNIADTAHLHEITALENVMISGIHIMGQSGDNIHGIVLLYAVNSQIKDCFFTECETDSINIESCVGIDITDSTFVKANRAGFGYGVAINNACQGIMVSGNTFQECRHGVTIGGYTRAGIPRGITVDGNYVYYGIDAAMDCHDTGENVVFSNNVMNGVDYGISFHGHSGAIVGNSVVGANSYAIKIASDLHGVGLVVSGNTLRHSQIGIWAENVKYLSITGNVITDNALHGIYFDTVSNSTVSGNVISNNGYYTNDTYDGFKLSASDSNMITGNTIYSVGANRQQYAINISDAACDGNFVFGNFLANGGASGILNDLGTGTTSDHNVV